VSAIGSLAWGRRTGGRLSALDRLRLLAAGMLVRIAPHAAAAGVPLDAAALRMPDSRLCVAAGELLAASSEPWLVQHCLRTFLWGALLGRGHGHRYDEELLFVGAALHDLGLTPAGRQWVGIDAECFAVQGALAAEAFLGQQGMEEGRRERIAEAICRHLNVRVPLARGVEAHLLHAGAGLDVIGARHAELAPELRQEVLRRHPRDRMKESLAQRMKQESLAHPHTRAGFLCSHGFIGMIRKAPFPT
jgi:hypothetical protein